MGNRLIAAGNDRLKKAGDGSTRLRKAADAAVDPAVPAELQRGAAVRIGSESPSVFAGGRVLSADDITGTPEEQLAYVTERLLEIDALGKRAEDFTVLNKGVLLEVAQERELHKVAGYTNFAQWAASVLDIEPKYVFELLQDAARIRTISALGDDLARHLTRASARKVMADVIADQGVDFAQVVMAEGLSQAEQQGKKRPTAALLASIAKDLSAPSIPHQESKESRSEISDLPATPEIPPVLAALDRAAAALKQRVLPAIAPAAVRTALEADTLATREHLERLEAELQRVSKRLASARRAADRAESPKEAPNTTS